MPQSDIGLVGLAVMGENLALNMARRGFSVSVYNRTAEKTAHFVAGRGKTPRIRPADTLPELVSQLRRPRKILLMVRAGSAVDGMIEQLLPLLSPGDVIIDGGNSHFGDTARRCAYVESRGFLYVGMGVSGGEEGALKGPSLMPGGSAAAWPLVRPIFEQICARANDGAPCCAWIGPGGAGHFVKMVHNGIEYGDMQLICEAYHLMRDMLGMTAGEMQAVFADWGRGELSGYLMEITGTILGHTDSDGAPLVERILDAAMQKGTGKWTAAAALELGVPLTLITEAVFSRSLSAQREERCAAGARLSGPAAAQPCSRTEVLEEIRQALLASKIISYAQGFSLMRAAAQAYGWPLRCGDIALIWRGGCIIRSVFLDDIRRAFDREPALSNLMLDDFFRARLAAAQSGWRSVCARTALHGIPVPAMSAALSYYDGLRCTRLPANLLQAQRDCFGAHTYERTDCPRGTFFHTDWTGEGGDTASGSYSL